MQCGARCAVMQTAIYGCSRPACWASRDTASSRAAWAGRLMIRETQNTCPTAWCARATQRTGCYCSHPEEKPAKPNKWCEAGSGVAWELQGHIRLGSRGCDCAEVFGMGRQLDSQTNLHADCNDIPIVRNIEIFTPETGWYLANSTHDGASPTVPHAYNYQGSCDASG